MSREPSDAASVAEWTLFFVLLYAVFTLACGLEVFFT